MENQEENNQQRILVELFVKASPVDKADKGPCPISQKWFMVFYSLVKLDLLDFKLTSVNLDNLPQSYLDLNVARRFPVVRIVHGKSPIHGGKDLTNVVYETDDEIEQFMESFQCPTMIPAGSAFKVTENLYRNFNTFLVRDTSDLMLKDLANLDKFLADRNVKYLSGDELSYVDCHVMPKLQHIRVVCENYKNFLIPSEFRHLWKYFATMYECEAFHISCPSDRDILMHYYDKVNPRPARVTQPTLIEDYKTLSIPENIDLPNGL
jgi:chloride intracellular channel protein 2